MSASYRSGKYEADLTCSMTTLPVIACQPHVFIDLSNNPSSMTADLPSAIPRQPLHFTWNQQSDILFGLFRLIRAAGSSDLRILAFAPKALGETVMNPGESGAAGELNNESTSVGLKSAIQKATPLIIMWQHSDEEAPCWDGESGVRCACGCGPLDGIASR
jgi:hypothetical protein